MLIAQAPLMSKLLKSPFAEITCMLESASGQVTSVYITIIGLYTWSDAEACPGLTQTHTFSLNVFS